ncbi:hypothetical protein [Micromonospora craniellae]|uniref:Uncharacterized protein n=1 Tax=Micromonospora craniellae TaxID=2294034 RepID=A0A372FX43_9ACTN|nr:hypothetical protein [Micromonospora craniellae]QOC93290.1 hypothetical protein ID554_06300 [Micromonospora craniellae]RFS45371.1 hypothetical protein D0Q02_17070 [Micromonospora craniellae]
MRVDGQSTDPIDQILGELPVPTPLTPEDVRLAVRAVVVHAAEEWPTGALCRNDGARFPCRLHRWGRKVLLDHGLNERQLDALIRHGNPFVHVPFPFLVNGPQQGRTPVARPAGAERSAGYPGRADRAAGYPPRTERAGHPARGPVPRVTAPAARAGVRTPGRPVAPPATAPRWPRAS